MTASTRQSVSTLVHLVALAVSIWALFSGGRWTFFVVVLVLLAVGHWLDPSSSEEL